MTVHWNARKGFQTGPNGAANSGNHSGDKADDLTMAELLLAMRKVPDSRPAVINRGRKLLADPNYPSPEVLRQVAGLLADHLSADQQP
jgi:hypothetical protein